MATTTITAPSRRPKTRRARVGFGVAGGLVASLIDFFSASEHDQPRSEPQCERECRIDDGARTERGVGARSDQYPADDQSQRNADNRAEHPRRKERAQHVDRRTALASSLGHATPRDP